MKGMIEISQWTATLPGAWFHVPSPSWLQFGLYYATVFTLFSGALASARGRRIAASLLVAAIGICGWQWHHERKIHQITILPLNGGSAIFSDAPGRQSDLLVDCGNLSSFSFVTQPFLQAQGVHQLPWLALTHGDIRYFGAAELVLDAFRVKRVAASGVKFRSTKYQATVAVAESIPDRRTIVNRDDTLAGWSVLHPAANDRFPQADDNALVLSARISGVRVLLLSDLGRIGQQTLLERDNDLKADIVVAGLPEQSDPLVNELLDVAQPKVIIITDSEFPATRRANAKLRERLERRGIPVLYTRDESAVILTFTPEGWSVRGMNRKLPAITVATETIP
jgi:beta-lactamase superfamily II metal-dependent hydrolase